MKLIESYLPEESELKTTDDIKANLIQSLTDANEDTLHCDVVVAMDAIFNVDDD